MTVVHLSTIDTIVAYCHKSRIWTAAVDCLLILDQEQEWASGRLCLTMLPFLGVKIAFGLFKPNGQKIEETY